MATLGRRRNRIPPGPALLALLLVGLVAALASAGVTALGDPDPRPARPNRTAATTVPIPPPPTADPDRLPAGTDAVVVSVTDGDTIVVRTATGATERVRLIGIDTPETRDPRRPVECFGREAAAQTAALLPPGTAVRLEPDVEARDRYDRRLAYVWRRADALFVNAALVEGGWATPYRYPPNVRYAGTFTRLGADARSGGRGLWSACPGADG